MIVTVNPFNKLERQSKRGRCFILIVIIINKCPIIPLIYYVYCVSYTVQSHLKSNTTTTTTFYYLLHSRMRPFVKLYYVPFKTSERNIEQSF